MILYQLVLFVNFFLKIFPLQLLLQDSQNALTAGNGEDGETDEETAEDARIDVLDLSVLFYYFVDSLQLLKVPLIVCLERTIANSGQLKVFFSIVILNRLSNSRAFGLDEEISRPVNLVVYADVHLWLL